MSGQSFECTPLEWFEHVHIPKQPPSNELCSIECFGNISPGAFRFSGWSRSFSLIALLQRKVSDE